MSKRNKSHGFRVCCFCGLSEDNELEYGKFHRHGDIVTHYYCLLLSSNMEQKGTDDQGILGFLKLDIQKEVRRGKRLVCSYCKKSGATLGCCNVKCKRIFHYPCGLRAGTLNQFFGEFRSYCINHRPKQKIDIQVKNEIAKPSEVVCYICYDNVDPGDVMSTIWAPCCKKNAWFHRKCVQQLAVSAGYFFKCPLCNDKKSFQKAMLEFGIFIPSQDASWELVPNAFQELLYRHDQCDAPICLCPKGRKYTSFNARWELALCRTCGSQGIHMACGRLKWGNPIWECKECTSILGESNGTTNVNISTLQNDSDSEASEISVGKDSPIPFTSATPVLSSTPHASPIKLRPGPRTFKLKQLKAAKEMLSMRLSNSSNSQATQNMVATICLSHVGESTSNNGASPIKSHSLLSNLISRDCEEYPRSVPEHSKSLITPPSNNFITFDSDDDVEITSESSSNSTLANGSRSESAIEDRRKNSISPTESKLLGRHNFKKTGDNGSMTSNVKVTKTARLSESSSQDVEKPSVLEEIINLDQKDDEHDHADSLSNIQISNVISLPPEEFEIVTTVKDAEGIDDIECLTLQNRNDLLNNSRLSRSLPQNGSSDTRLKRKIDKATLNATTSPVDKSKKMRRNLIAHELGQKSSFTFVDVKNSANSIISLDNISPPTFNKTEVKIDNSTKENNASANVSNSQSRDKSYIEIEDDWVSNKSTAFVRTYNAKPSAKGAALKHREKDNSNGTVACSTNDTNEINKIPGNTKTEELARNCDGDAGTSPAARSGNRSLANDTEKSIKPDRSHSRSDRSDTTGRRRSQNDIEMAAVSTSNVSNSLSNSVLHQKEKENGNECHHPRLTSEYVHLRDLKFRVCNSNNLQMILYNKYLVNINMESATTTPKKNARFSNSSTRKAVQQKPFKAQNETVSNCKCEDKYSLLNVQSDNYRDETKENLDPVTPISCKSVADNLSTSAALIASNLTISASSNNQSDGDNPIKSVYNGTKVIDDNKRRHGEDANLISNTESIFDAEEPVNASPHATANCADKHFRSINNVKRTIQSLSSDLVASSISATELYQRGSRLNDHANCKIENRRRSASGTRFKVSIDLERIEDFIDDNPDLFDKHKSENCKESFNDARLLKGQNVAERINLPSRSAMNSATDELKSFGDLTLSLPRNKMLEFRSRANESSEDIEDLMAADDLVQKTRSMNNSLSHNPTCNLKRTSSRFEKQCISNR